ncbi:hypothetical protein UFOVP1382_161 [uncultured Caudovirales phage]|uniref:Uncharacterized protein n=1 Tax=uncultured Caudovirales phage TaxID=2100421 RepID=A0A6J5S5A8_9CAUD|nr:hypothetical protein UFOVP1382_161 [uncultured Caudovirales phage]
MFQVGDKVIFGRENGQATRGTVMKVNAKSVQIRQEEPRGRYPVGTPWRVHPNLVERDNVRSDRALLMPVPPAPCKAGDIIIYEGNVWGPGGIAKADIAAVVISVGSSAVEVHSAQGFASAYKTSFATVKRVVAEPESKDLIAMMRAAHGALEPENLTADGERARSEVNRLHAHYSKALRYLEKAFGRALTDQEIWAR